MTSAQLPCPTCGRLSPISNAKHLPFCSERCRLIDLGRWLDEENALPTAPADDDESADAANLVDAEERQRSSCGSDLKPGGISYRDLKPGGISYYEEERKPVKLPPGWHDA